MSRSMSQALPNATDDWQHMQDDTLFAAPSMHVGDDPEVQLLEVHLHMT